MPNKPGCIGRSRPRYLALLKRSGYCRPIRRQRARSPGREEVNADRKGENMGDVVQTPRRPFGELKPLTAALALGLGLSFAPTTYAATFTVTNLNDNGAGSLRAAITSANGAAGADIVNFQAGLTGTITLTTGEIAITDDVTITGPGAASMTITKSGAAGRLLDINVGTPTVT